ncbi:maltose ABC transporter ATP-binding protein /trehalose ABC transporter ATP-binding protein /sucrose ABC transporter ATP-binding protein [Albimonas donghaensis]|uniref:Maltose ABC transporter ATP-binding protein /trehalose ABC transporter ATP-binding protein /sucrose ABC transporter ATP-binding protein n=1 Tax=Albimonas donghaensis TaxID=356660 RepID=A0A1H3FEV5_9RHOB|nr:ABC transporter ATP-binding protein [Albimonas donghaensis]SDX88704.1 maltose ABC transporter ATP-binding protein /trehalose ABC transporter ATP-binding protein /sucrose ABC transporter ATP-binding protein [Albimonas donghaensis]
MTRLTLDKIAKSYGTVEALRDIDLAIEPGEFVVFVGPSGCGKSTLLRVIAGLEEITAGDLNFDGTRVNDLTPAQRGIAMVFQSYALYPHMSVYENMAFGLKLAKTARETVREKVEAAAEMLQLSELLDRLPRQLSGGQRQRVAIGRAIVRDPRVFLFDEPLSNLDAALRVQTRIEIAALHERMAETTMIYVTHDQVEAMTLADRIVVLRDGRVEQVGAPMELYDRPANTFVAQFIGSPAMNLAPARPGPDGLTIPGCAPVPLAASGEGLRLGVRPEALRLAEPGEPVFNEGPATLVEKLGETQLVYFEPEGAETPLIAKLPGALPARRGEVFRLAVDPADLRLFGADGKAMEATPLPQPA